MPTFCPSFSGFYEIWPVPSSLNLMTIASLLLRTIFADIEEMPRKFLSQIYPLCHDMFFISTRGTSVRELTWHPHIQMYLYCWFSSIKESCWYCSSRNCKNNVCKNVMHTGIVKSQGLIGLHNFTGSDWVDRIVGVSNYY